MTTAPFRIGMLMFPNLTHLDVTCPHEIFASMPGAEVHLLWKTLDPIRSERGLMLLPTTTLKDCPPLDLICVPGGPGIAQLLDDEEVLDFIRHAAARARYVTSVCSGSLVLGAAGLLRGRRAATHWMSRELLRPFGATPVAERVVIDGNLITGGGATAGLDWALRVVAEIAGQEVAETIQLYLEYDPHPPFNAGTPDTAPAAIVERVLKTSEARQKDRADRVRRACEKLEAAKVPA